MFTRIAIAAVFLAVALSAGYAFLHRAYTAEDLYSDMVHCLRNTDNFWRNTCYVQLAKKISAHMPLEKSLDMLASIQTRQAMVFTCHSFAHGLGSEAYNASHDIGEVFRKCSAHVACGEGCYHGAIEAYLREHGASTKLTTICGKDVAQNEVTRLACNHGIGHGLMLLTNNEIPKSLEGCDTLTGTAEKKECYTGVFMENTFDYQSPEHPTKYVDPSNPMFACRFGEKYEDACYDGAVSLLLRLNPLNFRKLADFCAAAAPAHAAACYGSIGNNVVVSYQDAASVAAVCNLAPRGTYRDRCLSEALKYRAAQDIHNVDSLADICLYAQNEDQNACFKSLGYTLWSWFPGTATSLCAEVSTKGTSLYNDCLNGIPRSTK